MARMDDDNILGRIRGKIDDKTIADTKYGPELKNNPKTAKIITPGQKKGMNIWAYISGEYDTLTEQEALWWVNAGRNRYVRRLYTKEKHIDGRNLFFSVNSGVLNIGDEIVKKLPEFKHAQTFSKINVELVEKRKKKDIILTFEQEILHETVLIIHATKGVKEVLTYINPNKYKRIGIIDREFKSGDSIMEMYMNYYKTLPEQGLKIGFLLTPVNRECGHVGMTIDRRLHFFTEKRA